MSPAPLGLLFPMTSLFLAGGRGGKNESSERPLWMAWKLLAHIRENFVTGPHLLAGNSRKYILQPSRLGAEMSLEE